MASFHLHRYGLERSTPVFLIVLVLVNSFYIQTGDSMRMADMFPLSGFWLDCFSVLYLHYHSQVPVFLASPCTNYSAPALVLMRTLSFSTDPSTCIIR